MGRHEQAGQVILGHRAQRVARRRGTQKCATRPDLGSSDADSGMMKTVGQRSANARRADVSAVRRCRANPQRDHPPWLPAEGVGATTAQSFRSSRQPGAKQGSFLVVGPFADGVPQTVTDPALPLARAGGMLPQAPR